MRAFTVIAVLAVLAVAQADIWSNCGDASATLQNIQASVTPNPPAKGKDVEMSFSGDLKKTITGGKMHLTLSFLGVKVVDQTDDLCTVLADYQSCPINAGHLSASIKKAIPAEAPSGDYTGKLTAIDQDSTTVACIDMKFKLA